VTSELLDDFRDVTGWSAIAPGRAQLTLSQDDGPHGKALRLDFDFHGAGGFVVARKRFRRALPARYAFRFQVRGEAPANKLEWKLVDPAGTSVWWARREAFAPPVQWQPLRIPSSEIEFAWGPAGGGPATQLGALELAIVAGPGGRGTLWLDDLVLEDLSYRAPVRASASSAEPGCAPERTFDGSAHAGWRSAPGDTHWLTLDFGEEREVGGLVLHWDADARPREVRVGASSDGERFEPLHAASEIDTPRSYAWTPGRSARHLRLDLRAAGAGARVGVREIELLPEEATRSVTTFFQAVAQRERRGLLPRYLLSQQSVWTPVGVSGARACALLGEAGMLEVDRGAFSLEPFLFVDGALVTWADAEVTQQLAVGGLPIPSSRWRAGGLELTTTAFATGDPQRPVLQVRYRVASSGATPRRARLFVAIRPFQVTPPWQAFHELGGVTRVDALRFDDGVVEVNGTKCVVPLRTPDGFGAASFAQGGLLEALERGELPARDSVRDDFGYATGALRFDVDLAPGAEEEVALAVPFGVGAAPARASGTESAEAVAEAWRAKLGAVSLRVPESARDAVDALRSATAHILILRDGAALQPGPRRYTRSWIRDAATMSAALLRLGCRDEVRAFLRWYAPYQAPDGNVPCCVDRSGPDWLPEHDSHGQLIYTLAEYFRFSGDAALVRELWPAVQGAVAYLEKLRAQRVLPEFAQGDKRACHGLLPESVSHEGYLAQPVHAYWDDFWALRGLSDAAWLADAQGRSDETRRFGALRDALGESLYASIAATRSERGLDTIPGCVEWADFDPSATACALVLTDAPERLPEAALARTYDQYLEGFRTRRDGRTDQASYTPYEIRIVGALLRLGRRDDAHELLRWLLDDRRPRAWNQWPEIAWRDPRSPGHLGDLPHAWIGAEYVLALLACFAYERPGDDALVVAAGVPDAWLAGGFEPGVASFATAYGPLAYRLCRDGERALVLTIESSIAPPGGIVLRPPLAHPLVGAEVDGRPAERRDATSVTLVRGPATVRFRW
jgi:hypothetical protein